MEESTSQKTTAATPENISVKAKTASENTENQGSKIPLIILGVILLLAGLVYLFIRLGSQTTGMIRDVMLIIFVLESVVTVAAVAVLCVQIAKLVNFLKYDVEPILKTTDKTVKKLSGTVSFLCDNAVEPTIDTLSSWAGVKNAVDTVLSVFKK